MTCREFDEIVHGYVRMELLDVSLRESVVEHAAHCERCAVRLADAAVLADASEMLASGVRREQTPAAVQATLVAAFRDYHRRTSWKRTWEWASIGAAAAILLIFLWTVRRPSAIQPAQAPRNGVSTPSNVPLDAKAQNSSRANDVSLVAANSVSEVPVNDTYAASDFVPVPYTGAINADDPGMIVRVQLTRSSLAQLGYPLAETPDEDLVLADVLVGEDGWPRGVKLIQ